MKTRLLLVIAGGLVAAGVCAQPLHLHNVTPGIYCRFSPDCHVNPVEQSSSFTPTNMTATCVLESRSFPGNSMDSKGDYGYEYRVILNRGGQRPGGTLTVKSLTLNFETPQTFAFGGHANNQVWVVNSGGPGSIAPGSAAVSGTNVVVRFSPPLVLATKTGQTTGTYYFGMVSTNQPRITKAIIAGSAQADGEKAISFKGKLSARTP